MKSFDEVRKLWQREVKEIFYQFDEMKKLVAKLEKDILALKDKVTSQELVITS